MNFENKIEDQFDTDGGGNKSIISGSKTGSTTFTIAGLNYQSKLLLTCVKTADLLTTAHFGHDVLGKRFIAHVTMVFSTAWPGGTDMNRQ